MYLKKCVPFVQPHITVQEFWEDKSCIEQPRDCNCITNLLNRRRKKKIEINGITAKPIHAPKKWITSPSRFAKITSNVKNVSRLLNYSPQPFAGLCHHSHWSWCSLWFPLQLRRIDVKETRHWIKHMLEIWKINQCHYQDKCTPITSRNINQQLPEAFQSLWSEHGLHIVAFIGSSHKSLGSGLVSA